MELKKIGNIVNTKGINGSLVVIEAPKNLFLNKDCEVFVGFSENFIEKYILAEAFYGSIKKTELMLKTIDSKEKAQKLKDKALFATKENILKNNTDYIFYDELLDCKVYNIENNDLIGDIVQILELPANNVWMVATDRGELPLPVIDDVIKEIDINNKIIKIKLIDGLLDLIN